MGTTASRVPPATGTTEPRPGEIGERLVADMVSITSDRITELAMSNARDNLVHLRHGVSLRDLPAEFDVPATDAVVLAAGPSLHRKNVADTLIAERYDGAIITTDSGLRYCLKHGIVPSLVVTLDPHPTRIVRWFGDPNLTQADLASDDYFSRQDMDRNFADEMRANDEILALLDRYGSRIRLALSTSASPAVVKRAVATGMRIYWWNPMLDDPDDRGGATRALYAMNRLPCLNAGGNVGTACWMISHAVLGHKHVALTGVDFSYYDETPYEATQYYHEAVALVGRDRLDSLFMRVFNPHTGGWFYTDPAYMWYRNSFLELVRDADCATYNCTEGGILFGERIEFVPLRQFLRQVPAWRRAGKA
jgi:hypothetical protein